MKLEDLGKMSDLHSRINALQIKRRDITKANMVAIVYQERIRKSINAVAKDRFIIVKPDEVLPTEQIVILNQIKSGMLKKLDAQIKEIEFQILDL